MWGVVSGCGGHAMRLCGWESSDGCLVAWDIYECVTWRKLQMPGTAEEQKIQEAPTVNPNGRQPAPLTDQAPGTIERAAQESTRLTPTSTAAVHAFSTATTRHHYPYPYKVITRSSQPTQPAAKHRRAEPHYTTDTTRLSGDMKRPPAMTRSGRWTAKGARPASVEGKG